MGTVISLVALFFLIVMFLPHLSRKANPKLRIILIVIIMMWATFWIDNQNQLPFRDPFVVGKEFVCGLIIQDKTAMEAVSSNKELNRKVAALIPNDYNNLRDEIIKGSGSDVFREVSRMDYLEPRDRSGRLELISFAKYAQFDDSRWETPFIICTYAYGVNEDDNNRFFYYTLLLRSIYSPTLWEKSRQWIHKIPFIGDRLCAYPDSKPKWIVEGFYTKDNYMAFALDQIKTIDEITNLPDKQKNGYFEKVSKLASIDLSSIMKFSGVELLEKQNQEAREISTTVNQN